MIYLDNAGTTPVLKECVDIVKECLETDFYNPSALYSPSVELSRKIRTAREEILTALRGDGNLVFTSSGSESDNTALFCTKKPNGSRIIVSATEHPAVYNCAMELLQRGYDVVFCGVDEYGRVKEDEFRSLINENTSLISIMHVNNETGCVNDIKKLCKIAKSIKPGVLFHSDGVQAVGKIKVNLSDLGVDLYSISGHKIHAPKGIAGLYIRAGVNIRPYIFGGGQEGGLRSSTENVSGILSFAYALKQATMKVNENADRLFLLRKKIIDGVPSEFRVVDCPTQSPYILYMAMPQVRGEVMLHSLEKYGVYIGTGSACSSKKTHKRLPALLGFDKEYENGTIRVSLNRFTSENDIDYFIKCLNLEYNTLKKYVRG